MTKTKTEMKEETINKAALDDANTAQKLKTEIDTLLKDFTTTYPISHGAVEEVMKSLYEHIKELRLQQVIRQIFRQEIEMRNDKGE